MKRDQIEKWLDDIGIKNYTINEDLTVNVDGDIRIASKNRFKDGYLPVKFNIVNGDFIIYNTDLKTLDGVPKWVMGNFDCDFNHLKDLKNSPKYIGGDFRVGYNKLFTLKGCTEEIGGDFVCVHNQLNNIRYAPKYIGGDLYCLRRDLPNDINWFLAKGDIHTKTLLKYQEEYGLWKDDGTLNNERWRIFYNDFMDGILT